MANGNTEILYRRTWFTQDGHDRENLMFKSIIFDQDCFYDIRMLCADVRQSEWKSEFISKLSSLPADNYMTAGENEDIHITKQNDLKREVQSMNGIDHSLVMRLSLHNITLLGSTQDGLYLDKGFHVYDTGTPELNDSDIDTLYEYGGVDIIKKYVGNRDGLWLTPKDTAYPGYFKLQVMGKSLEKYEPCYFKNTHLKMKLYCELYSCKHYVVASDLTGLFNFASVGGNTEDELGIHDVDHVAALRMDEWPDIAHSFISRERRGRWPDLGLVESVISKGCGFVAKGHSQSEDYEYQWRISFAESEKILSRSLNPAQIRAYLFFKSIFKTHLKSNDPDELSSYMMKTILFWTIESTDQAIWTDENIVVCVKTLVNTLYTSLDGGVIPSFFAPTLNLVGQLDRTRLSTLANKAKRLNRQLFPSIIVCVENPAFKGMCTGPLMHMYELQDINELEALLSMVYFSTYLYLRLQVLMYQQNVSISTLDVALDQSCRSMCSVVAPKAAWYLLESIKIQPCPSLFYFRRNKGDGFTMDVSGMRRRVVDFWRSTHYTGLFTRVVEDQRLITGHAVATIPEFDEFMEWVNCTCLWSSCVPVNRLTERYPPNLD